MITGDHIATAKAIAKELNILAPHDELLGKLSIFLYDTAITLNAFSAIC